MSQSRFPGPYVNSTEVDHSIMEYVPMNSLDIGARVSGMPKGGIKNSNSIDHVGNSTSGAVKHKQP